jgi:hypothetical protein
VQTIYRQAVIDRQVFARDVFHYLLHATGARNPNDLLADPSITPITPVQYAAAKYLAQLAVNIVDYIDSDDYITAFPWDQASTPGTPLYLFGTEMPNLVINEVYAQQDNDSNEATLQGKGKGKGKGKGGNSATDYHLNFWVELVNPHNASAGWPSAPYPVDKGTTYLSNNSHDIYKVMVWAKRPELVFPDPVSDPSGVTPLCIVGNSGNNAKGGIEWPAAAGQNSVAPLNGAFSGPTAGNTGFYLLGPSVTNGYLTMRDPGFPAKGFATHNAPAAVKKGNLSDYHNVMSVIIDADDLDNNPKVTFSSVTVVLRRLACPHAPYDPNPVAGKMPNPFYNPYITVDVFDDIRLQANHDYDANGATKGSTPTADLKALGRIQPFQASNPVHTWATPTAPIVPHHTFFRHNSNYDFSTNPPAGWPAIDTATAPAVPSLKVPFDWLVHLDRPVINPIELLHVSAYPPDQLTTQFYNGGTLAPTQPLLMQFGDSTNHNAPWMTEASLLYRFLGFAATPSALSNAIVGGRVPGKININTTYRECIRAILDYDARFTGGSGWTTQFADQIATNILNRRGYDTATMSMFDAAGNHRWTADPLPIMPFTSGLITGGDKQFPSGLGINHTLLAQRLVGTGPGIMPVFDPSFTLPATPPPPYAQSQYLQKAFNNLTTTSNCYALWLTVGFFEVIDDTVQPAKLGAELGRSQNRHIRHRFFSIIDRSDLTILRDTVSAAINVDSPANWNTGTASASTALLIDPQGLNDNSQILPQRFLFTLAGNAVPNFVDDLTVEILDPATGVHELAKAKVYYANASVPTNGVNPKTLSPLVKAVPGIYPTAQSPMLKVELFNSYGPGAIVTLRGNPGPQPMTYTALTAAPVAASATVPKLVPSTVPVRGPLTNKMVGQLVTVGPDPVTGLKEHAVLQDLRTESGFSATGPQLVLFLTNAYNANTPISWTDPTVYSVRHDRAVVPHYNIME